MYVKEEKFDVGVIVARFQIHTPHEGQLDLVNTVREKHARVIIFLGLSPVKNTLKNPLDFQQRKHAIQELWPDVEVYYLEDNRSDQAWSNKLDSQLNKWLKPLQSAVLYGSRDSFIRYYTGKYNTRELESEKIISASEIRKKISLSYPSSQEFRAGIIAATFDRYPACLPTVDVAVYNKETNKFLMGFKPGEGKPRFLGGFATPDSDSFEEDAKRELIEESGNYETTKFVYISSKKIDDWRYRSELEKIKTTFYFTNYLFGPIRPGDDIAALGWYTIEELRENIMPEHEILLDELINYLKENN